MTAITVSVGQLEASRSKQVVRSSRKVDVYTFGVLGINSSSTCTFTFSGHTARQAIEVRVHLCYESQLDAMEESDFALWTKQVFPKSSVINYEYTYDPDEEERATCFRFDWYHRPAGARSDDDLVLQCSQFYKAFYHDSDCLPTSEEFEGLEQVTKAELGTIMSNEDLFPSLYAEKAATKQLKAAIASNFSATSPEVNDSGFIDSMSSPASKDPDLFPAVTSAPLSPAAPVEPQKLPKPTGQDGKVFLNSLNKKRAKTAFVLSLEQPKKKEVEEECSSSPAKQLEEGEKYCDCGCGAIVFDSPAATSSSQKDEEEDESHHSESSSVEEKETQKPEFEERCPCGCGQLLDPQSNHSSRSSKPDIKMEEPKVEAATLQARVQQDENVRAPVAADHAVLGVTLRMDEDEADQQAYTIEHAYMTEKASILRKHQEEYKKAFSYDSAKHQEMMHATHAAELALLDFEKTHSLGQIRKRKRADGIVPSPKRVKVALRDMALTPFMSRMIARHPENGRQFFAIKDRLEDKGVGMADLMNADEGTGIALQIKCETTRAIGLLLHKALNEGL